MKRRLTLILTVVASTLVLAGTGAGAGPANQRFLWSSTRPNVVLAVETERPLVALTFDDGPNPQFTPTVLSILQSHGARATFFDTGQHVWMYPELARRTAAMGNEIGNHTWNHPLLTRLKRAQVTAQLRRTDAMMRTMGVPESQLFRPPYGAFDAEDDLGVKPTGKRVVGWDFCVEKELRGRSVDAAVAHLLQVVRPGSIILAHDAGDIDRSRTMQALPALIDGLHRLGFRVVTAGELLRA